MMRYYVEPTRLLAADDAVSNLVDTSHSVCVNVLRQLSSLALTSGRMFQELGEITAELSHRTTILTSRVNNLRQRTSELSVEHDLVSADDLAVLQPYKSSRSLTSALTSRPQCIIDLYTQCEAMPALERLNQFRSDEKDCRKLYTDPNFFFELWSQQMVEEAERKKPVRKNKKKNSGAVKVRLPENRVEQMKRRAHDLDISIKSTNDSASNKPLGSDMSPNKPTANQNEADLLKSRLDDESANKDNHTRTVSDFIGSHSDVSSPTSDSAANEREPLSPALPMPPPILLRGHSRGVDQASRGKSIYSVADFDRNSAWLPPPPPPDILSTAQQVLYEEEAEDVDNSGGPVPPAAPVPPPPPPPVANVSGFVVKTAESSSSTAASSSSAPAAGLKRKESRTDLLQSIRAGIQLRKVAADARPGDGGVAKKSVGAGLFDVQAIMEMRRRVFEDDADDDDDEDNDDDWAN